MPSKTFVLGKSQGGWEALQGVLPVLPGLISLLLFFLLSGTSVLAQEKYTISGHIRDATTGEELIGATVYVQETKGGTSTNSYGYYSITLEADTYNLTYSFVGKKSVEKTVELTENKKIDVELGSSSEELDEVTVTGEKKDRNVKDVQMSADKIEMEQVEKIPAFLGEVDVLKTVQLLPGVQSGGEGSTGFNVRGGGSDQNMILLDEATVYNASHFFNFFSVFNPDAVKDFTLYKGGTPARYGGRLSSVLDIRMKEGNSKDLTASGGIGTISSRATVEGPIKQDTSSFLLTGRRTYADLFLNFANDSSLRNTDLYFYDLNGKVNYTFDENNTLYLSGYFGRDVTQLGDLFGFDWGNATGTVRWNHLFSDKLFSNFSFVFTNYQFNIQGDVGPQRFEWRSFITDYKFKADFSYYPSQDRTVRFGLRSTYHQLDPGIIEAEIDGALASSDTLSKNNGWEHGAYISHEHEIVPLLKAEYGFRLSGFQRVGPGNRYELDKGDLQEYRVTDSVGIDPWTVDTTFLGWEPRLSLRYTLDEKSSIKASYQRMVQYVQRARSSTAGAPFDTWYTTNNNIPPQTSNQVALGYFRNFADNAVETSAEFYYKSIGQLSDYVDNADILGNEYLEKELRIGRGWSYGMELLAKKKEGDLTGWLSYTWSRTERKVPGINEGDPYFAPYDQRHNLSLTMAYPIKDWLEVSTNFAYRSGKAITLPVGRLEYQGDLVPVYGDRNVNRLPAYHRVDFGVTLGKNDKGEKFSSHWDISVYNVYARKNPITVDYSENDQGEPISEIVYIPGPLPAITWNFVF